jgi:hypothetical protein
MLTCCALGDQDAILGMTPRGEIAFPRGVNKSPSGTAVNPRVLKDSKKYRTYVTKIFCRSNGTKSIPALDLTLPPEWNGHLMECNDLT